MRRRAKTTAALVAAVFLLLVIYVAATLPPRPRATTGAVSDELRRRTVPGAFHVHSTRSDGTAGVDAIAAAAARAGLGFVIVTDHGDGTRAPDPPAYRHGVLVIDAVEVSTRGGHYVAVGMPAAPYPLGGDASAVVEDVRRLGGFGVAAHTDSAKPELRWNDDRLAVDGREWLNLDSEWRDEPRTVLARVALDYIARPAPALASILDRPTAALERWRVATAARPVVALAAHDAHGGISEGGNRGARAYLAVPSYYASFSTFALRAVLEMPFAGEAAADAEALVGALRRGSVFTAVDAAAAPAFLDYRVDVGGRDIRMGESAQFVAGAIAKVRVSMPPNGQLILVRDGVPALESGSGDVAAPLDRAGVYHVEVRMPGLAVPWLLSNPVYLRARDMSIPEERPQYVSTASVDGQPQIEKDAASNGTLTRFAQGFEVAYRLAQGARASQYVAVAVPLAGGAPDAALVFDARATRPMRVSVQLRFNAIGGARWGRSVYLSPSPQKVAVPVASLVPLDRLSPMPDASTASSVLFVADLTNASPGQSGAFEISHLSLASPQTAGR